MTMLEDATAAPAVGPPLDGRVMRPCFERLWREKDRQHPGVRMRAALARLSRDRWLSPAEVLHLSVKFAGLAGSHNPTWTAKRALPDMVSVVGMLRGDALCTQWDTGRGILADRLKTLSKRKDGLALCELEALNFVLKKGRYQWTRTN